MKSPSTIAIVIVLLLWAPVVTGADTAAESPDKTAKPQRRSLPLYAESFEKYGYKAPLPFGAALGVMSISQDFVMDGIRVGGQDVEAFSISSARGSNNILMPRVDMWLLPFLDLYVLGGTMAGTMNINVTLYDIPLLGDRNLPIEFEFEGWMLGGGATLAGGYKFLFAMLDGNYSQVSASTFESKIDMAMFSARLGVATSGTGWEAMFWAGGMYQNMDQTIEGQQQLGLGGDPVLIQVDVGAKDPWNMVIGSRLQAGRHLALLMEAGFIGRRQLFANLEYRF